MDTDWSMEARKMAYFLSFVLEGLPQGILDGPLSKCMIVFGNDGYDQDVRVRLDVSLIEKGLRARSLKLLGFGVDPAEGRPRRSPLAADPGNTANRVSGGSDLWDRDRRPTPLTPARRWLTSPTTIGGLRLQDTRSAGRAARVPRRRHHAWDCGGVKVMGYRRLVPMARSRGGSHSATNGCPT